MVDAGELAPAWVGQNSVTGFRHESGSACAIAGRDDLGTSGRATFHFRTPVAEGEPRFVWRRIGTRKIFTRP